MSKNVSDVAKRVFPIYDSDGYKFAIKQNLTCLCFIHDENHYFIDQDGNITNANHKPHGVCSSKYDHLLSVYL